MSSPDLFAAAEFPMIPRDESEPVFPAPWAARAFALSVALQESGLFSGGEWASALGGQLAGQSRDKAADPEAYWRAWLAALETLLERKRVAQACDLTVLQDAWRQAAAATPHGQPIELPAGR